MRQLTPSWSLLHIQISKKSSQRLAKIALEWSEPKSPSHSSHGKTFVHRSSHQTTTTKAHQETPSRSIDWLQDRLLDKQQANKATHHLWKVKPKAICSARRVKSGHNWTNRTTSCVYLRMTLCSWAMISREMKSSSPLHRRPTCNSNPKIPSWI